MEENYSVFIVVLVNSIVISEIKFTKNEIGKDEVVLINPFLVEDKCLTPYLMEYTSQKIFYTSPSKIITLASPNKELQEKYLNLVKE